MTDDKLKALRDDLASGIEDKDVSTDIGQTRDNALVKLGFSAAVAALKAERGHDRKLIEVMAEAMKFYLEIYKNEDDMPKIAQALAAYGAWKKEG